MQFIKSVLQLFVKYQELFLSGIQYTLTLAIVGTICGLAIGLVIGGLKAISKQHETNESLMIRIFKKVVDMLTYIYITVVRGTPMMVQGMLLWYGYFQKAGWGALTAGCLIVSVNTGAYMAEIIRSGIMGIDKGQSEGARSIGMSSWQTMRLIVLPQALKNSIPSIVNELIVNIKDSCVLSVMMIPELFFQAKSIAGSTYKQTETYTLLLILYLIMTSLAALLMGFVEKKVNHKKSNYFASQTMAQGE